MHRTTKHRLWILGLVCLAGSPLRAEPPEESDQAWREHYQGEAFRPEKVAKVDALAIENRRISAEEIRYVATLPRLTQLKLGDAPGNVEIDRESLQLVGTMGKLEFLQISKEDFTDGDLDFLPRLGHLKKLWLQGSDMTDPGVSHGLTDASGFFIAKLDQLEELRIDGRGPYSDEFFRWILKLPKLRSLEVHTDGATDETLRLMAKKESLSEVKIWSSSFTQTGLQALMGAKTLKSVEVRWPHGELRVKK